jgi:hypothetical protein
MMKPRTKILVLIFSLIVPYMALAMYFVLRIGEHSLPTWFPYFGIFYILGTMIFVMLFSRRISRGAPPGPAAKPRPAALWLARTWSAYLVIIWSGFFIWGAYQTISGNFEWQRALFAGACLLAFIGLFSRSLYRDFKGSNGQKPLANADPANKL